MTPADAQDIYFFCISFNWESWGSEVGLTAAASLITFPTCFVGGQAVTGVLMQMSAKVSQNVAKAVALVIMLIEFIMIIMIIMVMVVIMIIMSAKVSQNVAKIPQST